MLVIITGTFANSVPPYQKLKDKVKEIIGKESYPSGEGCQSGDTLSVRADITTEEMNKLKSAGLQVKEWPGCA